MTGSATAPCRPRTEAQAEASRRNGARSQGPVTPAGKARSALNGTRHGLCSLYFFLLPDEDPQAFALFVADFLAVLGPRDHAEHQAAERAALAKWRVMRADRLEAEILTELFAAKALPDEAEARAVRAAATKALGFRRVVAELAGMVVHPLIRRRPFGEIMVGKQSSVAHPLPASPV